MITPHHRWLLNLVGDWAFESVCNPAMDGGPDDTDNPMRAVGQETYTALGDCFVVGASSGPIPDAPPAPDGSPAMMHARMTLGYNTHAADGQGRFIGSWVSNCMHSMFVYEGTLDAPPFSEQHPDDVLSGGRVLTLNTTGPAFAPDGTADHSTTAHYQDVIELIDTNTRLLRSRYIPPSGDPVEFMRATYTRLS